MHRLQAPGGGCWRTNWSTPFSKLRTGSHCRTTPGTFSGLLGTATTFGHRVSQVILCLRRASTTSARCELEAVERQSQKSSKPSLMRGFPLPKFGADGDFGTETQTALQSFQRENGLEPDGIVGPSTMGRLDATIAPTPTPPAPQGRELTEEELRALPRRCPDYARWK